MAVMAATVEGMVVTVGGTVVAEAATKLVILNIKWRSSLHGIWHKPYPGLSGKRPMSGQPSTCPEWPSTGEEPDRMNDGRETGRLLAGCHKQRRRRTEPTRPATERAN